jgi:multiple sugar transport system permease protein
MTVALLKFLGSWNAFLWVLIMTNSDKMRTVPVGLTLFSSEVGTAYEQLMAASVLAIIPVLILFFFTQKQFIQGVARTGIK